MDNALHLNRPFILKNLFELPNVAEIRWEPFRDGIDIHRLYQTESGASAALLRHSPGASLQRHMHTGHEHIVVLRGSQIDESGEHIAGTLLMNSPGSSHTVRSPGGCIVLIIWERPVTFVDPDQMETVACESNRSD